MRGKLQDLSELTTRRFYDLSEATALEAKSGKENGRRQIITTD